MENNTLKFNFRTNDVKYQNAAVQKNSKDRDNCFNAYPDWVSSAVSAIEQEFCNMDDFLMLYKKSQGAI